jgi:hypothetical protein
VERAGHGSELLQSVGSHARQSDACFGSIECFLADDNAARILGSEISGIRVQVNAVDADAAVALLDQPIPEDNALDGC